MARPVLDEPLAGDLGNDLRLRGEDFYGRPGGAVQALQGFQAGAEGHLETGQRIPHVADLGPEDAAGSCRVAVPHEAPFTEPKDETEEGHEVDALWVLAHQMAEGEREDWPEQLFLLGDQVYVDEGSPKTRKKIKERRGTDTPPFGSPLTRSGFR